MSVPSAFFAVHWVFLEYCVKHVCAVDLAGEIAVVAGVVAAEKMAEGCFAMSCGAKLVGFQYL